MGKVNKAYAPRWILALLVVALGLSPEAVLCISTGHVTVESSACCVPGVLNSAARVPVAQPQTEASDPCGPCEDISLGAEAVRRLASDLNLGQHIGTAPAALWCGVDDFATPRTRTATVSAHSVAHSNSRLLQSVILLL